MEENANTLSTVDVSGMRSPQGTVALALARPWSPRSLSRSLVPATAGAVRSEFFGIVQGPTLDGRDLKGLQKARVRTDRFMLNWGWVQPTAGLIQLVRARIA